MIHFYVVCRANLFMKIEKHWRFTLNQGREIIIVIFLIIY